MTKTEAITKLEERYRRLIRQAQDNEERAETCILASAPPARIATFKKWARICRAEAQAYQEAIYLISQLRDVVDGRRYAPQPIQAQEGEIKDEQATA